MYKLSGVTKDYRGRETVHALRGVDLTLEDGAWLAVQGPTGHGKSTLLQIMGGLERRPVSLASGGRPGLRCCVITVRFITARSACAGAG